MTSAAPLKLSTIAAAADANTQTTAAVAAEYTQATANARATSLFNAYPAFLNDLIFLIISYLGNALPANVSFRQFNCASSNFQRTAAGSFQLITKGTESVTVHDLDMTIHPRTFPYKCQNPLSFVMDVANLAEEFFSVSICSFEIGSVKEGNISSSQVHSLDGRYDLNFNPRFSSCILRPRFGVRPLQIWRASDQRLRPLPSTKGPFSFATQIAEDTVLATGHTELYSIHHLQSEPPSTVVEFSPKRQLLSPTVNSKLFFTFTTNEETALETFGELLIFSLTDFSRLPAVPLEGLNQPTVIGAIAANETQVCAIATEDKACLIFDIASGKRMMNFSLRDHFKGALLGHSLAFSDQYLGIQHVPLARGAGITTIYDLRVPKPVISTKAPQK